MTEDLVSQYATGELSKEFWQGLIEQRLLIPKCNSCSRDFFFPRRWCPFCWSEDVAYHESPGKGEIFALSELHTAFQGVSKDELPVTILIVQLDEDVRLPGRLAKECVGAAIGDRVRIRFSHHPETQLPQFVFDRDQ